MRLTVSTVPGVLLALLVGVLTAQPALAMQESNAPAAAADQPLLGEPFNGEFSGITFRPPADLVRVSERAGELARYVEPVTGEGAPQGRTALASFVAERVELAGQGLPLQTIKHINPEKPDEGNEVPGILEESGRQFLADVQGTIHRQDVVYLPTAEVGVLAVETRGVPVRQLTQVAIVRVSDRVYFRLAYIIPLPAEGDIAQLEEARQASDTFAAVLDSIALVDLADVRERQEQWLLNTRSLLVNWTEQRVTEDLKGEHWLRVLVNGQDAGYYYVVEERADGLPRDSDSIGRNTGGNGVRVGVRSQRRQDDGTIVDREAWSYYRFNRAAGEKDVRERSRDREEWHSTSVFREPGAPANPTQVPFVTEIGSSQRKTELIADSFAVEGENRGVRSRQIHELTVTRAGRDGADPSLTRPLPEWYMPQVLAHLAPRLLPLERERGYMFAQWVPERSEVMARYLEVLPVRRVNIAGEALDAWVVSDRVGLTGSVTEHYFDPKTGAWLASQDRAARRLILPSSAAELEQIWADTGELKRTEGVNDPAPPQDAVGN